MSRELDRRDFSENRSTATRESALRALASDVSDRLPGEHRIRIARFDSTTGNPAVVRSEAASAEKGNYVQRALDHMRSISRALGNRRAAAA
jgi:extracellular elastinolytic metalloproteinase